MQAAFDYAVEYIHDRKQFGHPVGTFQLMQGEVDRFQSISYVHELNFGIPVAKIADMYTKLNASRSYVYAVARACDQGKISRRVCICWIVEIPQTPIKRNESVIADLLHLVGLRGCNSILDRKSR